MKKKNSIFRKIANFFDKYLVLPITRIVLKVNQYFDKSSHRLEAILSKQTTLVFLSLIIAIILFIIVDQKLIVFNNSSAEMFKDQKVEDVGKLINLCTENGADSIDSLRYSCSNYDEVYAKALADAVKSAKEKAFIIAEAEGKKVGDAIEITEGYQDTYYQYKSVDSAMMNDMVSESAVADIIPGQADIDASVTVTFEIVE